MGAIRQSASQFISPDSIMGYGVPNFQKAYAALFAMQNLGSGQLIASPNPFTHEFTLLFDPIVEGHVKCRICDISGRRLFEKTYTVNTSTPNRIRIGELALLPSGMYLVTVFEGNKTIETKLLKL